MPSSFITLLCVVLYTTAIPNAGAEALLLLSRQDAGVERISRKEVADLYLARNSLPRFDVHPLDQEDAALRARFYRDVAGMSLNRVRAYWARRVFTGRGRPPSMVTLDATAQALATDSKAITYVPAAHKIENSKVLFVSE